MTLQKRNLLYRNFYKIVNNELKLIKDYDPIPNEIYNSSQSFKCCKCLNENESSALLLGFLNLFLGDKGFWIFWPYMKLGWESFFFITFFITFFLP